MAENQGRTNFTFRTSVNDVEGQTEDGGLEIELEGGAPPEAPSEIEIQPEAPAAPPEDDGQTETPLDALRREFEKVRSEKVEADRRAFEAAQRARDYEARLQTSSAEWAEKEAEAKRQAATYETRIHERTVGETVSEKNRLEVAYDSEKYRLDQSKKQYAAALSEGEYDKAAELQVDIARATQAMSSYENSYRAIEAKEASLAAEAEARAVRAADAAKAPPPEAPRPAPQTDPFEDAVSKMHPKVAAWVREHKADVTDPERQKIAFAADGMATARGFAPGSDEYLALMNDQMGYAADPAPAPEPPAAPQRTPTPTKRPSAAPASRSTSSSVPLRIKLSEWDRDQARMLKMSEKDYATIKAGANQGQLDPHQMGGRLQVRYVAE